MTYSLSDLIALAALLLWPAIPLFWVPVHCMPQFFRRLGFVTYILPFITWLPVALLIFLHRDFLLGFRAGLPAILNMAGVVLFGAGAVLQVWTLVLLTLPVIMGMPEVTKTVQSRLVSKGPFSVVRHPTYLSHASMLLGLYFATGITALGVVAIVDICVVNAIVIPLEEKELLHRFGIDYAEYRSKVPSRFFPFWNFRHGRQSDGR